MTAMVKIAILLFLVFTATALENPSETDSVHELHPCPSPAPSPSPYVHLPSKISVFCDIQCALGCHNTKPWEKTKCIAACVALCTGDANSFSEVDCVVDCTQSSTNSLRHDANMMDDRIVACALQCKKD